MILYIPQNIDPYNTHLKNLIGAYSTKGISVISGYGEFKSEEIPDVIHFHQIEGILTNLDFNQIFFFNRLDYYKQKGVLFLYTAHNLQPHRHIPGFDYSGFFKRFLNYIDLFIHHGENSIHLFLDLYPDLRAKKHIVCHHGDYLNDMKDFSVSREKARSILKLSPKRKMILIFGQLQYKNTGFAKEVFQQVKNNLDCILIMAGVYPILRYNRVNRMYYYLNNKVLNHFRKSIWPVLGRFSQYETYLLFTASDVVFLPHETGLTTGIIPLAATLGKPFVYPEIGVFAEQSEFCEALGYKKGDHNEAVRSIEKMLNKENSSFDNTKWLEHNNWDVHVNKIISEIDQMVRSVN